MLFSAVIDFPFEGDIAVLEIEASGAVLLCGLASCASSRKGEGPQLAMDHPRAGPRGGRGQHGNGSNDLLQPSSRKGVLTSPAVLPPSLRASSVF